LGCSKKKAEGPDAGEAGAEGNIAKFDEGYADFREAIRFTSLTPNKVKAAESAGRAEAAFAEVKRAWPEEPPKAFEGDNDWENRIRFTKRITSTPPATKRSGCLYSPRIWTSRSTRSVTTT
jgi:hypothetical protein